MRIARVILLMLACASAFQARAHPTNGAAQGHECTTDDLIHAEVSPAITQEVTRSIQLLEPGARIRDVAKLILPCGFQLDARYGSNLVLTDGTQVRRYVDSNPFGFAPPFGFSEQPRKSYTLQYRVPEDGDLHLDACSEKLKGIDGPQLCSGFGSGTSFFGTKRGERGTRVAHFNASGTTIEEDFAVAMVDGRVESIFFIPPPDAPGGTITLILLNGHGTFRAFLDTPKG